MKKIEFLKMFKNLEGVSDKNVIIQPQEKLTSTGGFFVYSSAYHAKTDEDNVYIKVHEIEL